MEHKKEIIKEIMINLDDWNNIIKSELKKRKLENQGYSYIKTKQIGLSKYILIYGKLDDKLKQQKND